MGMRVSCREKVNISLGDIRRSSVEFIVAATTEITAMEHGIVFSAVKRSIVRLSKASDGGDDDHIEEQRRMTSPLFLR
uniref:Uncharacterized protein n=1 Tax=Physcomitrium patens TaxID=3218 RepID=A0A2K1JS49_PHYPA|nr:hypothetical protein PHYPA_016743 [Physcomitrium patens]